MCSNLYITLFFVSCSHTFTSKSLRSVQQCFCSCPQHIIISPVFYWRLNKYNIQFAINVSVKFHSKHPSWLPKLAFALINLFNSCRSSFLACEGTTVKLWAREMIRAGLCFVCLSVREGNLNNPSAVEVTWAEWMLCHARYATDKFEIGLLDANQVIAQFCAESRAREGRTSMRTLQKAMCCMGLGDVLRRGRKTFRLFVRRSSCKLQGE